MEFRYDKAKREAEKLTSNLIFRAKVEGDFIWNLTSRRHRGRGGAQDVVSVIWQYTMYIYMGTRLLSY